jgi:hypothetical protein
MEDLYSGKNGKILDPRGMFLVQGKDHLKVWVGSQIPAANIDAYRKCIEDYIPLLNKYERSPSHC